MTADMLLSALFAKALTPGVGINIRSLAHGGGAARNLFYANVEAALSDPRIAALNATQSIYFGTALRDINHTDPGTKAGCTTVVSLWSDLDAKDYVSVADPKNVTIEEREAGKQAILAALEAKLPDHPPSALVDTGGGIQPHWFLRSPLRLGVHVEVEDIEATLRGLCTHLGVGASRPNVDSIMRLPGTVNRKYPDAPMATLLALHPERVYTLDDFSAYREAPSATQGGGTSPPGYGPRHSTQGRDRGRDFPALLLWLRSKGWVGKKRGDGYGMTCPWSDGHTSDSGPTATRLTIPTEENGYAGGFDCKHQHCTHPVKRRVSDLYLMWTAESAAGDSSSEPRVKVVGLQTTGAVKQHLGRAGNWLVDRMLAVGDMSLLVAKAGIGKSTFAAQLAVCVAYGRPFLGRECKQGLVVYLAFEGARSTIAQMERLGHDGDNPVILMYRGDSVESKNPGEWLAQTVRGHEPALIIVDTLSDFARAPMGASNAGYDSMVQQLGAVYQWAQAEGRHVHLLHHGAKGDREGIDVALGTVGIVSKPGTVLDYRPLSKEDGAPRVLKGVKHREGDVETDLPGLVLDFSRERGLTVAGIKEDVLMRDLGVALLKVIWDQPGIKQADAVAAVEGRKQSKLEAVRRLVTAELVDRDGKGDGSRMFPFRLAIKAGLSGDPVETWKALAVGRVSGSRDVSGSRLNRVVPTSREPHEVGESQGLNGSGSRVVPTILSKSGTTQKQEASAPDLALRVVPVVPGHIGCDAEEALIATPDLPVAAPTTFCPVCRRFRCQCEAGHLPNSPPLARSS